MNPLQVLATAMLLYASTTQPQVRIQLSPAGNALCRDQALVIHLVVTNLTDHPVMLARDPQAISTDGWDVDVYCDEKKMSPSTVGYFAPPAQCPWLSLEPMVLAPNESRRIPISLIGYFDYSVSHDYKVVFNYNPQQPTQDCEELIRSRYNLPLEYLAWKPLTDSFSMHHDVSDEDEQLVKDYLAWKATREKKPNIPGQSVSLEQLLGYLRDGGKITDYPGSTVAIWARFVQIQSAISLYCGPFMREPNGLKYLPMRRASYSPQHRDEVAKSEKSRAPYLIEQCRFILRNHPNLEPVASVTRVNLAALLYITGDTPGATEQLCLVIKAHPDWDEGKAAKQMLEVISAPLPQQAPASPIEPSPKTAPTPSDTK